MTGITLIGPLSRDIVRFPEAPERQQPGGAVYYAGMAFRALNVSVQIITAAAREDADQLLRPLINSGAAVTLLPSERTCCFINDYSLGMDARRQEILSCADRFSYEKLPPLTTEWVYLAPLINRDIPAEMIHRIAENGAHRLALDVQGFTRRAEGNQIAPQRWIEQDALLGCISVLKADAAEAALLTGQPDPVRSARLLGEAGAAHVLVTLEGSGAVIYHQGVIHEMAACRPRGEKWPVVDTTGCGDTFLAAYLARLMAGELAADAGRFAAAAAALKLTAYGPLRANQGEISALSAAC